MAEDTTVDTPTDPVRPAGPPASQPPDPSKMSFAEYQERLNKLVPQQQQTPEPEQHPVLDWFKQALPKALKAGFPALEAPEVARSAMRGLVNFGREVGNTASSVGQEAAQGLKDNPMAPAGADVVAGAIAKVGKKVAGALNEKREDAIIGKRSNDKVASFAENATQFAAGFAAMGPLGEAGEGATMLEKLGVNALKFFGTDATSFNPHDNGLAEMAASSHVPLLSTVGALLSVKGDDSEIVARTKRGLASVVAGVPLDALVEGARFLRSARTLASSTADDAEKAAAHEQLQSSQKTMLAIADGTHTPEGAHVVARPHPDGDGTWTLEPVHQDEAPAARQAQVTNPEETPERSWELWKEHSSNVPQTGTPGISVVRGTNAVGTPMASYVSYGEDGTPNGVVHLLNPDDTSPSLNVRVRPDSYRRGIATRLYQRVAEDGHDVEGISSTELRTDMGEAFASGRASGGGAGGAEGPPESAGGGKEPGTSLIKYESRGDAEADAMAVNTAVNDRIAAARQAHGAMTPEQISQAREFVRKIATAQPKDVQGALNDLGFQGFDTPYHATVDEHFANIEARAKVYQQEIEAVHGEGQSIPMERLKQMADGLTDGIPAEHLPGVFGKTLDDGSMAARAAKTLAANDVMRGLGQRLASMWDVLSARPDDELLHEEGRWGILNYMSLQRAMSRGASAEGLALRARQDMADALTEPSLGEDGAKTLADPDADLKAKVGAMSPEEIQDFYRRMKMSGGKPRDAQAIYNATRITWDNGLRTAGMQYFINNLLSSFKAPFVVGMSAQMNAAYEASLRMLAGAGRGMVTGDWAQMREGADLLTNYYRYFKDNVRVAKAAFDEGQSVVNPMPATHAWNNLAGQAIRTPGRAITFSDEFSRVSNYRSYVAAKSLRDWREAGLTGEALQRAVERDIKLSFDDKTGIALYPEALEYAERPAFTSPLDKGSLSGDFSKLAQQHPMVRAVSPFIKVSTNILNYTWENTPGLNLLQEQARETLLHGSAEERGILAARTAAGLGVYGSAVALATAGRITGSGPSDPATRNVWLQDHKPYSVKIGDQWISYARMEPWATMLGTVADAKTIWDYGRKDDATNLWTAAFGALVHNFAGKSYMKGIHDFMDAVNAQETPQGMGTAEHFARQTVAQFVAPQFLVQNLPDNDVFREVKTLRDAIFSRVPGLSDKVPARYDFLGNPESMDPSGYGLNRVNPIQWKGSAAKDSVADEIVSLHHGFTSIPRLQAGGKVDMADKAYAKDDGSTPWDRYHQLLREGIGDHPPLRKALSDLIQSPEYQKLSPGTTTEPGGDRWDAVSKLVDAYRKGALGQVQKEYPKFQQALKQNSLDALKQKHGIGPGLTLLKMAADTVR